MIKNLHVFGPFRGPTGYDNVVRNVVQRLYFRGTVVGLHEFKEWSGISMPVSVLYRNMQHASRVTHSPIMLCFCLPEQITHKRCPSHGKLIANYTMIESNRIPENWVQYAASTDVIILPTEYNRNAWIDSGVNANRIEIVPLGVDELVYKPDVQPIALFDENGEEIVKRYKYRFMNIQEVVTRKNLTGLVRAWMRATKGREDCCLILKLNSWSGHTLEYINHKLEKIRQELGIKKDGHAPIFAYHMILLDAQMPSFLAACTHYISMSCGEGWDLNMMSAAAMNKRLIAPRNSSYREYLVYPWAQMIDCMPEEAKAQGVTSRIYAGSTWDKPSEDHAVEIIEAELSTEPEPTQMREQVILQKYTWDHTTDGIARVLEERLVDHKPVYPVAVKEERSGVLVCCKSSLADNERCGISEYSKALVNGLKGQMEKVGLMGGHEPAYMDHIDNNNIKCVHFQYEYQFHSPERLKHMFGELRGRDMKIVVTQHTLNRDAAPHNAVVRDQADAILVHSERSKQYAVEELHYDPNKVHVVTMACHPVIYGAVDNVLPMPADKFKVGFFGFSYFHKGINKLIASYQKLKEKHPNLMLVIISNKPEQDAVGYFEQCVNMLNQMGMKNKEDYFWADKFIPEDQIVGFLKQCEAIVLPYDDYGGVGTSAAVRTVMRAGKPVLVSDTCWFADIPASVAPRISDERFARSLSDQLWNIKNVPGYKDNLSDGVKGYVEDHSWELAAKQHIEIYSQLAGTDTSS